MDVRQAPQRAGLVEAVLRQVLDVGPAGVAGLAAGDGRERAQRLRAPRARPAGGRWARAVRVRVGIDIRATVGRRRRRLGAIGAFAQPRAGSRSAAVDGDRTLNGGPAGHRYASLSIDARRPFLARSRYSAPSSGRGCRLDAGRLFVSCPDSWGFWHGAFDSNQRSGRRHEADQVSRARGGRAGGGSRRARCDGQRRTGANVVRMRQDEEAHGQLHRQDLRRTARRTGQRRQVRRSKKASARARPSKRKSGETVLEGEVAPQGDIPDHLRLGQGRRHARATEPRERHLDRTQEV